MKLSEAVDDFLRDCLMNGYSPRTVRLHRFNFNLMIRYLEDPELDQISPEHLQNYMIYLKTEYKPIRPSKDTRPLSNYAIDNHWKSMRVFFRFLNEVHSIPRPDERIKQPRFQAEEIVPFSNEEVEKLMNACSQAAPAKRQNSQKTYARRRTTAIRDIAILYVLLDTGMRAGELERLEFRDVNLELSEIHIRPFHNGLKSRPRTVFLGRNGRRALLSYMKSQRDALPQDSLFGLTTNGLRSLLLNMGKRAQVPNVHPHRFRHTFAMWYLRQNGDVFTLKKLLGHSTLDMVQRYLHILKDDARAAHALASPGDRVKLR